MTPGRTNRHRNAATVPEEARSSFCIASRNWPNRLRTGRTHPTAPPSRFQEMGSKPTPESEAEHRRGHVDNKEAIPLQVVPWSSSREDVLSTRCRAAVGPLRHHAGVSSQIRAVPPVAAPELPAVLARLPRRGGDGSVLAAGGRLPHRLLAGHRPGLPVGSACPGAMVRRTRDPSTHRPPP